MLKHNTKKAKNHLDIYIFTLHFIYIHLQIYILFDI